MLPTDKYLVREGMTESRSGGILELPRSGVLLCPRIYLSLQQEKDKQEQRHKCPSPDRLGLGAACGNSLSGSHNLAGSEGIQRPDLPAPCDPGIWLAVSPAIFGG